MGRLSGTYSFDTLMKMLQGHFRGSSSEGVITLDYFSMRIEIDTNVKTVSISRINEKDGKESTQHLMTLRGE